MELHHPDGSLSFTHREESINLSFVNGPVIDLGALNGKGFDYSQIGGVAVWYRLKDEMVLHIKGT